MTLLQTAVLAGSIAWGVVSISHDQTSEEEKQRTEQKARDDYERTVNK